MRIDRHAQSYDGAADVYERARPDYGAEPVAHVVRALGIGSGSTVLDLAAGTGKFTRRLLPSGARVVAVEPVAGMRAKLTEAVPGIKVLEGTAEAIPLPDASMDAVTVAQAFHWFRGREALREIRRVLKPGGGLALVWNVADLSADVNRRLSDLVDPHADGAPRHETGLWREAFVARNGFTPLERTVFSFRREATPEQVADRIRSASFVASMLEADRERLLEDVRSMLRSYMAGTGHDRIMFPAITDIYICRRIEA